MGLGLAADRRVERAAPRVLIVSGAAARVQRMRDAVQSAGYSVGAVVQDVPSAFRAMAKQRFDAVVIGDADVYCLDLVRSTLSQGIPFALVEASPKGAQHSAGATAAQVLH